MFFLFAEFRERTGHKLLLSWLFHCFRQGVAKDEVKAGAYLKQAAQVETGLFSHFSRHFYKVHVWDVYYVQGKCSRCLHSRYSGS